MVDLLLNSWAKRHGSCIALGKNSGSEQWYVHVSVMWIRRSTSGLSENLISESFMQVMTKNFMFRNLSSSLGSDLRLLLLLWLPQI